MSGVHARSVIEGIPTAPSTRPMSGTGDDAPSFELSAEVPEARVGEAHDLWAAVELVGRRGVKLPKARMPVLVRGEARATRVLVAMVVGGLRAEGSQVSAHATPGGVLFTARGARDAAVPGSLHVVEALAAHQGLRVETAVREGWVVVTLTQAVPATALGLEAN
ncbi:MAG: hypothetical protein R3A52_29640 [Polyangiales bacterium]